MVARFLFRLPDIGEGVAEAEIGGWHIAVGDRVEEDQSLVDVMTDKASIEMTSPVAGVVMAFHGEVGAKVAVGSTLVELEIEGENEVAADSAPVAAPVSTPAPASAAAPKKIEEPVAALHERPLASPATRRRARERNIPLHKVSGTGPRGRITTEDLDAYVDRDAQTSSSSSGLTQRTGVNDIKIIGMRRKIAEKMQESKRRIPHFSYVEEFDMTELEALRRELNDERTAEQPKLTLLPFFMRALVKLAAEFPQVNARYDDDAGVLHCHEGVHIGIATQTDAGLMVPVVRHAETLDIWACARELIRVTTAARTGKAKREELSGSTITLTSLGTLGGIAATPIINHPEVAIIGPNKLVERPVVLNGQIAIRTLMNLSSSFDHRIVDGYDAARFVQRLKRYIERPAHLFLEQ
jgi:2-oxoisovalerate dehydrogenase E2 component (dihydrolipoyl transacylase)